MESVETSAARAKRITEGGVVDGGGGKQTALLLAGGSFEGRGYEGDWSLLSKKGEGVGLRNSRKGG